MDEPENRTEDLAGLSRLDREVLRSYVRGGDVTPLDGGKAWEHSKQYHDEIRDLKKTQRWMLVKGYFTLFVIIVMGALIIWQVYLWASSALDGRSLLDRARTGTEEINPLRGGEQ